MFYCWYGVLVINEWGCIVWGFAPWVMIKVGGWVRIAGRAKGPGMSECELEVRNHRERG